MSSERGHTLLAFMLGGVIGAGIALLYAPDSGPETRRRIKDGYGEAENWAKDRYNDARDRIDGGTGRVKDAFSDKKADIKAAIDAGKEAYFKGREKFSREKV